MRLRCLISFSAKLSDARPGVRERGVFVPKVGCTPCLLASLSLDHTFLSPHLHALAPPDYYREGAGKTGSWERLVSPSPYACHHAGTPST